MNMHKMLAGTAIATTLLLGGALPAAANVEIPLGGYVGPAQLNFDNYESFKTASGAIATTPEIGDENFGVFSVTSIKVPGLGGKVLWSSGQSGDVLVGVFDDINVTNVTVSGSKETTSNTGGIFKLYLVPQSEFQGDLGLAGYTEGGCSSIGGLCYNGITNTSQGNLVLTMDLVGGVVPSDPSETLSATLDAGISPATGAAKFDGTLNGDPQFALSATGKDSFCPNATTAGCPGADETMYKKGSFAIASQDPITAAVVPEPGSVVILGSALLSFGLLGRRRQKEKPPRS